MDSLEESMLLSVDKIVFPIKIKAPRSVVAMQRATQEHNPTMLISLRKNIHRAIEREEAMHIATHTMLSFLRSIIILIFYP